VTQDTKSLKEAFSNVWRFALMNGLCYGVTYTLYPNLCFNLLKGTNANWRYPIIVLGVSFTDCCAKFLNSWLAIREGRTYYIIGITRILLVPLFIMGLKFKHSTFFGSMAFGITLPILMAFSNGLTTSASLGISSERGAPESKQINGYIMIASMFSGVVFGTFWPMVILDFIPP
jgi:hypothetical protein